MNHLGGCVSSSVQSSVVQPFVATEEMLNFLKTTVHEYFFSGQYRSCLFWCEKLLSLGTKFHSEMVLYVRALIWQNQNVRAWSFIRQRHLQSQHAVYQYLGALALFNADRFEEAMTLLEEPLGKTRPESLERLSVEEKQQMDELGARMRVEAMAALLLGKCHLELENRRRAAMMLQKCLRLDPLCSEAFELLVSQQLLSRKALEEFAARTVAFNVQPEVANLVSFFYRSRTGSGKDKGSLLATAGVFSKTLMVRSCEAERLYEKGQYWEALELTKAVLAEEEMYEDCLPIHIALLVELERADKLFLLAHRLVDTFPESAVSWYAVGAYYFLLGSYDVAKRFLVKMAAMRPVFGPGWLLLAHSFAAEQEHDQSINCYLKASKLLHGCHLPLLYIGMEYGLSGNIHLGDKFLKQALEMSSEDPMVLNELAVMAHRAGDRDSAKSFSLHSLDAIFSDGLKCSLQDKGGVEVLKRRLAAPVPEIWEPLFTNLGNILRNQETPELELAILCHRKATALRPGDPNLLGTLGISLLMNRDLEAGLDLLHQVFTVKCENPNVYRTLLGRVMELAATLDQGTDLDAIHVPCPNLFVEIVKLPPQSITAGEQSSFDTDNSSVIQEFDMDS